MEKLKGSIISTFKSENFATFAGKLKHVALSIPLQFSVQALSPHSKNTARFDSLSQHSFFSQHNPHPHRMTHNQGLNGTSVSIVNDEQAMLPPHHMIKSHFPTSVLGGPGVQMPIGDPQPIPVPRLSIGSWADAGRDELRELAARVRAASFTEKKETVFHEMSNKNKVHNGIERIQISQVLELLCQILQTDSTAVQQWLLTAGQEEKDLVMGLLQIATANLRLEPQELPKSMEERFASQFSQSDTDIACRQQGRNHLIRLSVTEQEQEPIPEEEMQCISAQQKFSSSTHLSMKSKTNQTNLSKEKFHA